MNVLITYPNQDEEEKALGCYKRILNSINFKNDVLVIFGKHTQGEDEVIWTGFEYKKEKNIFLKY